VQASLSASLASARSSLGGAFGGDGGGGGAGAGGGVASLLPAWAGGDGSAPSLLETAASMRSYQARLRSFAALAALSLANFGLALFWLPLVVLRPAKFALFLTLGNALALAAFAALRGGAREQLAHLLAPERRPLTACYVGSLALTLYAALAGRSYVLVVCAAALQLGALGYYAASYIPGGPRALRLVGALASQLLQQGTRLGRALCNLGRSGGRGGARRARVRRLCAAATCDVLRPATRAAHARPHCFRAVRARARCCAQPQVSCHCSASLLCTATGLLPLERLAAVHSHRSPAIGALVWARGTCRGGGVS
jgi:hypothetical protein